ncbi:MAG: glycosyltransferase [Chloroflexi bacterium]|nr:glycosyltransferase [Chloroflexota bacterium]
MVNLREVTIVAPTRNESHNVSGLLRSLPPRLPLIVVDSSDDATPEVIARLRPTNTVVVQRRCSVTEARQIGAELARTPWLVFTDADVTFAADYFGRLPYCVNADALYGPKLSLNGYARYYRWFACMQGWSDRLGIPAASGSNLLIRRSAFMAVGGFDPQLVCNEDSEIVWRLKRCGLRVTFVPELVVYAHDHRRLKNGVARKTLHSLMRCTLLYLNLMPARWRHRYWATDGNRHRNTNRERLEGTHDRA